MDDYIPFRFNQTHFFDKFLQVLFFCKKRTDPMDLAKHMQELKQCFSLERKVSLPQSGIDITPCVFTQKTGTDEINRFQSVLARTPFCTVSDESIDENKQFNYTIFSPRGQTSFDKGIVLLHGLNERSWEKYLPWAEYLCEHTGKPIILFPIAFHMNRSPRTWYSPRTAIQWLKRRKAEFVNVGNATFVNVALSTRLTRDPLRFYTSGRESVYNICQLFTEIKQGKHPLFTATDDIHIFAYSIGGLLAQVLLMANPYRLFSNTKLFLFCGGSLFDRMNGNARDIMDHEAYKRMMDYYSNDFLVKDAHHKAYPSAFPNDEIETAFKSMINRDTLKNYRENFFTRTANRIRAITLKKDVVVPTAGARDAFGPANRTILSEWDFPFNYSHQWPFPVDRHAQSGELSVAFSRVFQEVARFM